MADILIAATSSLVTFEGRDVHIVAGKTTVRDGHPLLEGRESLFVPLVPTYEVTAAPEPVKPPRKAPAGKNDT